MIKSTTQAPLHNRRAREAGNIFFMLFASIAVVGAMTAGAGNIVKGIVTSMSDVTRKTITEEKMQGGARISIQSSVGCDTDTPADFMEPAPWRDAAGKPHPAGGGLLPEDIGATLKDPWGTEYGYCAWNFGNGTTCTDPNYLAGGTTAGDTVVAVISAGKDRKFSTTCNPVGAAADCSGFGVPYYNDPVSGHCYFYNDGATNNASAQSYCGINGAYLANITSSSEHALVKANFTPLTSGTWIGGSDSAVEGDWKWTQGPEAGTQFWSGDAAGSPVGGQYNAWDTGFPSTSSGSMDYAMFDATWNKIQNDRAINFYGTLCEISPSGASAPVVKAAGSDDIVMEYSYSDANGMSGNDLWKINDTKPGSAKIDKNIDVAGGAELSGPLNLMKSGLILPGDADTGVCDDTTDQQIRINFSMNPPALEICNYDGGAGDWTTVSMGGSGECAAVGDMCSDGTLFLNEYAGVKYYITPCDIGQTWDGSACTGTRSSIPYNNGNSSGGTWVGAQSTSGVDNTNLLISTDADSATPGVQPHLAAQACTNLSEGGHTDWFLPSQPEMSFIQTLKNDLGNFDNGFYQTSTETHAPGDNYNNSIVRFSDAYVYNDGNRKPFGYNVRCIRGDGATSDRPAMPSGYVGYWRFNEGTGATVGDQSGNNINGTISGATWTTGKSGNALNFDGVDDNVDLGTPGLLNIGAPVTVGAWVKLDTWGAGAQFYTNWASNKGIKFGGNGSVKVTNDTYSTNGGALALNTWHYITTTIDTTKSKIYVDGRLVTEGAGGLTAPSPASKVFIGGVAAPHAAAATDGVIDDVVVYNRALDAAEVQQLYQSMGGTFADPSLLTGNFLTDQEADRCTSAGTGPLVQVGTSDVSGRYYGLANAGPYLLAVGENGLSVFSKNNGSLTRLAYGGPASAGYNNAQPQGSGGIYVSGSNYHWVTAANNYAVSTFDGTTVSTTTTATGLAVKTVTGDGRYIYVVGSDGIKAYTNNGSSPGAVAGTYTNNNIYHAWSDGSFIYVTRGNGLLILKFDGSAFTTVAASVPDSITDETTFQKSTGDGRNLYLISGKRVIAYTFDGTTLTALPDYFEYMFNANTAAISTDGANIYASNGGTITPLQRSGSGFLALGGAALQGHVVSDMKSDGTYLYAAYPHNIYNSQPTTINVYSGAGCNTGNNLISSAAMSQAIGSYSGKITTNGATSCAIKPDGSVWCWGSDSNGALGNGSVLTADQDVPSRVQDSAPYIKLVSSEAGTIGLRADGTLWYWGFSYDGVLGQGTGIMPSDVPRRVAGNIRFVDVDTHQRGACGISTAGDAYCWGTNNNGRIGNGTTGGSTSTPTLVSGGKKWASISVSNFASCGIDTNMRLWCWGAGNRLGSGDTADKSVPTLVPDPGPWRKVEMNNNAACGIKLDGSRWCWGYHFRALGLGNSNATMWQKTPARTSYDGPFVDLSNNGRCAIKIDGTLWCSPDLYGPTGYLAPISDPGPWAAMAENGAVTGNCAIKTDGTYWCWGYDTNGMIGNGPVETGYQANPNAVLNMPGVPIWNYDDTALTTSMVFNSNPGAPSPSNIAMGSSSIGYKAAGPTHDCTGKGGGSPPYLTDPATGHCYYYAATAQSGTTASNECAKEGGYLASINSAREQALIAGTFTLPSWIDGTDITTEGSWLYTSGELAGNKFWNGNQTGNQQNGLYSNWASGEPSDSASNKDCILKTGMTGTWQASNCAAAQLTLCEVGTAGSKGGLSFPSARDMLLNYYDSTTELAIQAKANNTSAQVSWKASGAANTRSMGIDYMTKAFSLELNTSSTNAWLHDGTYSPQLFIDTDGRVGLGVPSGTLYNKLNLGGGLKVGDDTSNCHTMRAGTLRYVGGAKPYKYCNGSAWVDF